MVEADGTGQWLVFRSPYSKEFLSDFKAIVEVEDRRWSESLKAWCVTTERWEETEEILKKHYSPDVYFMLTDGAERALKGEYFLPSEEKRKDFDPWAVLGLAIGAQVVVIHAAYIALETLWKREEFEKLVDAGVPILKDIREAYRMICRERGILPRPGRLLVEVAGTALMSDEEV